MDYSEPLYIGMILGYPHIKNHTIQSEGVSANPVVCGHFGNKIYDVH